MEGELWKDDLMPDLPPSTGVNGPPPGLAGLSLDGLSLGVTGLGVSLSESLNDLVAQMSASLEGARGLGGASDSPWAWPPLSPATPPQPLASPSRDSTVGGEKRPPVAAGGAGSMDLFELFHQIGLDKYSDLFRQQEVWGLLFLVRENFFYFSLAMYKHTFLSHG